MTSSVNFTLVDNSNELTNTKIYLPQITAANHDTVTGDASSGQNVYELRQAINGVIIGNHVRRTIAHSVIPDLGTIPASAFAQREIALRVSYQDNVTSKKYELTFGTADLAALATQGTDVVDITSGAAATLVSALENYAVSPDGNDITVLTMSIVGRRS